MRKVVLPRINIRYPSPISPQFPRENRRRAQQAPSTLAIAESSHAANALPPDLRRLARVRIPGGSHTSRTATSTLRLVSRDEGYGADSLAAIWPGAEASSARLQWGFSVDVKYKALDRTCICICEDYCGNPPLLTSDDARR